MEQVFSYIIGLGAAVMMPIIFTILGVCIGIKFSKALKGRRRNLLAYLQKKDINRYRALIAELGLRK